MKDNNVILEVKDLHKSFGEQEVLKGISTEVNRGDVIAIIGPSGCGKSTFLRSLNLLETPTSGQILFEGTDLTDKSTDINVTRQKIGMVFQQFNLFANMTIKANIMLAPVKLGVMTKDEASKKADELLTRIGLLDKADAYPAQLSGGQKQSAGDRQHALARLLRHAQLFATAVEHQTGGRFGDARQFGDIFDSYAFGFHHHSGA